jgi:hypothetical protein
MRSGIWSVLSRARFAIFNKPSLKQRLIKALIRAVADGEAFPKIDKNMTCSRQLLFAIASEFDEPIPWHLCTRLGVPKGPTYSDAAVVAALREAGKKPVSGGHQPFRPHGKVV